MNSDTTLPLFVDLDGTLIKADMLVESTFALLKKNPMYIFFLIRWLFKGKSYLKEQIASRVDIDPSLLPYNDTFLKYLQIESASKREIILATATNEKIAHKISEHINIFTHVIASDSDTNLSGKNKLSKIYNYTKNNNFAYAGNSKKDMPIWESSSEIIVVNPEAGVENQANKLNKPTQIIKETQPSIKTYLKAIRIHQWAKNSLLFLPLLAAQKVDDITLLIDISVAFISFGLCASSVYLLNDMLDLPSDRQHTTKKNRPLAAGTVNSIIAVQLIPLLLLSSLVLALTLPPIFVLILIGYYITTLAYSFFLKKQVIVDVLLLASLYTIRVIAGSAATDIPLSFWLLAFSMFIFLSLALVKRSAELVTMREENKVKSNGRGYVLSDLEYLHSMGTSSGFLSVLVIALYINSDKVLTFYSQPQILWLLCPLLLYWISRVWLKTGRGEMNEDPVVFAFKDWQSQIIAVLAACILVIANMI